MTEQGSVPAALAWGQGQRGPCLQSQPLVACECLRSSSLHPLCGQKDQAFLTSPGDGIYLVVTCHVGPDVNWLDQEGAEKEEEGERS